MKLFELVTTSRIMKNWATNGKGVEFVKTAGRFPGARRSVLHYCE